MKLILCFLFFFSALTTNGQEIIPFQLGEDNRIYIKGQINQSDTLYLVFDLGANITVLNKTKIKSKNVNIKFDSIVTNNGGNGTSQEEKSFNNTVTIAGKNYGETDILGISYPEQDILDGIIGWNFFRNKIVKINFESQEITIYDQMPKLSNSYNKNKIKFIDELPYMRTMVNRGNKKVHIWAMLDTGYNSTIKVYYDVVMKNKLMNQYQIIGESTTHGTDGNISRADWVLFPKFIIGGFEIYNIPSHLIKTEVESEIPALLGGNLLKRFHIVLDFKHKKIYMKPNSLINSSF